MGWMRPRHDNIAITPPAPAPAIPPPRVPSSKCPGCGFLHQFDGVDLSSAPRRVMPFGAGAVIVCEGCAQVNRLARNLVLVEIADPQFLAAPAIVAERWRVVNANGLTPPDGLPPLDTSGDGEAPRLPEIPEEPERDDRVRVLVVWPDETSPVEFGYLVGYTAAVDGHGIVCTGVDVEGAKPIYQLLFSLWGTLQAAELEYGQRFTIEGGDGYEFVFAPVDVVGLGLGLPEGVYHQVVWQDEHGRWPWDENAEPVPLFAGVEWRPDLEGDPTLIPAAGVFPASA